MSSYLIAYLNPKRNKVEEDPLFSEYTYGDKGRNGKRLLTKVQKGDYLFFHTTLNHKRYITAFYEVETIMPIDIAKQNALIMNKYQNHHLKRNDSKDDEVIVFGHPIYSFVLTTPLEVNEELLKELSIPFNPYSNSTLAGSLASKLRNWLTLEKNQVEQLKHKILSPFQSEVNHSINQQPMKESATTFLHVIFKNLYELQPPKKDKEYQRLVKKYPNLELQIDEFYEIVNYYYMDQLQTENLPIDIGNYMIKNYEIEFEQSEGTIILLSYLAACVRCRNSTFEEVGKPLLKYQSSL